MTRSMFGISLSPDADIFRPFRAYISWLCHLTGLHPILMYYTPSGLIIHRALRSPEGVVYANDGHSPSDRERSAITSPERALYTSEAVTHLAKWEIYISETVTPLAKWEIYISETVTPLAIKTREL